MSKVACPELELCRVAMAQIAADEWDAARIAGAFHEQGNHAMERQAQAEAWRQDGNLMVVVGAYLTLLFRETP